MTPVQSKDFTQANIKLEDEIERISLDYEMIDEHTYKYKLNVSKKKA